MPGTNNNSNNKNTNEPLDPKTIEQLNAYLDYELSEEQRAQVRDLLRRSPAAENEMATLKATSNVLRELPSVPAPRSFAVRPGMLEQLPKTPRRFTLLGWIPTPSLALGLGSVAAACLLVLVLTAHLVSNGGLGAQQAATAAYNSNRAASNPPADTKQGSTPRSNSYVSSAAAQPTATTASAAAATPTTAPISASTEAVGTPATAMTDTTMAMAAPTPSPESANYGLSATLTQPAAGSGGTTQPNPPPASATSPHTPTLALAPSSAAPTATGFRDATDIATSSNTSGTSEASPTPENGGSQLSSTKQAPHQEPTPTPQLQVQASNNNTSGGNGAGISASGPVPANSTNQTGAYNVFQSMDYWLVIEIALAVLVVVLGLGAIVAQRRSR